jgi:hypothetical protein
LDSPPPKTPLQTPLPWPPWPWFACNKIKTKSKVSEENETLELFSKMRISIKIVSTEITLVSFTRLFCFVRLWFCINFCPSIIQSKVDDGRNHIKPNYTYYKWSVGNYGLLSRQFP